MSKQNVVDLAAAAHALIAKLPRMTLAAAVAEWNAVAGKFEIIGVPGRKAHLERLLTALVADIESEIEIEMSRAEAQEENNRFNWLANRWGLFWAGSDYFTRHTMIEDAHYEALEMDSEVNEALLALSSDPLSVGWHLHSPTMKAQAIRIAHAAALEIDAELNQLASLRHMSGSTSQVHRC